MRHWIADSLNSSNKRTQGIKRNILGSAVLKAIDVVADFLLVPLSLGYLTQTDYGIWLTLNAVVNWMNFLDVGVSHGFRNKLAIAYANEDFALAKTYTSTVYVLVAFISVVLIVLTILVAPIVNWNKLLNVDYGTQLEGILVVVVGAFALRLSLNVVTSVFLAVQMPAYKDLVHTCSKAILLLSIWLLAAFSERDLFLFAIAQSVVPLLALLGASVISFRGKFKSIRPSLSGFDVNETRGLLGLGLQFFVLQMSAIMLFATDNVIISHVLSPQEVVPYSVCMKYFGVYATLFAIVNTPFWSAFTESFERGDYTWIRSSVARLVRFWLISLIPISLMIALFYPFKNLWLGPELTVPLALVIQAALFVSLQALNRIYTQFINGVGKLRLSLVTSFVTLFMNIPLSIYFSVNMNLGLSGILLATNLSLVMYIVTRGSQYHMIMNRKASGIWNQ